jgi:ssDNA-specific exonuclease RecJ
VKSVSLGVIDIIDCEDFVAKNSEIVYNDDVYTQKCNCIKAMEKAFTFNREELAVLYKVLKRYGEGFGFDILYEVKAIMKASGHDISWFKIKNGLDIFAELGFIKRESKGRYSFSAECGEAKRNLTDSRLFSELSQKMD